MKGYLITTLLLLGFLIWPVPSASTTSTTSPQQELRQRLESLQAKELTLAQELLTIETRLQQAEREKVNLQKRIEVLKKELETISSRQAVLLTELKEGRSKVSKILLYLHRNATSSYLAAILSSQNFGDLIIRWELTQRITQFCLNNLNKNLSLYQEAQEKSTEIASKENLLQQSLQALQVQQSNLDNLKRKRASQLAKIKEEAALFKQTMQALDAAWSEAIPTLQYLLDNFSNFPWTTLKPDQVKVELRQGQVLALFTETNLNRTLLAGNDRLRRVSFEFAADGMKVTGPDFCISGLLKVAGDRNLAFHPQALKFAGIELDRSVWDLLLPGPELQIEMPPPDYGLKFKDLVMGDGRLTLILKR